MKTYKQFISEELFSPDTIFGTTKEELTSYYKCLNQPKCNALYKTFNNPQEKCAYCGSENIEEITKKQYYDEVKKRLEPDEIEDLEQSGEMEDDNNIVDLIGMGIKQSMDRYKKTIN